MKNKIKSEKEMRGMQNVSVHFDVTINWSGWEDCTEFHPITSAILKYDSDNELWNCYIPELDESISDSTFRKLLNRLLKLIRSDEVVTKATFVGYQEI